MNWRQFLKDSISLTQPSYVVLLDDSKLEVYRVGFRNSTKLLFTTKFESDINDSIARAFQEWSINNACLGQPFIIIDNSSQSFEYLRKIDKSSNQGMGKIIGQFHKDGITVSYDFISIKRDNYFILQGFDSEYLKTIETSISLEGIPCLGIYTANIYRFLVSSDQPTIVDSVKDEFGINSISFISRLMKIRRKTHRISPGGTISKIAGVYTTITSAFRLATLIIASACLITAMMLAYFSLQSSDFPDNLNRYQDQYSVYLELQNENNILSEQQRVESQNIKPRQVAAIVSSFCQTSPRNLHLNNLSVMYSDSSDVRVTAKGVANNESSVMWYLGALYKSTNPLKMQLISVTPVFPNARQPQDTTYEFEFTGTVYEK